MTNKRINFDDLFEAAALELEASFKRGANLIRPDEKGIQRETELKNFLNQWLPEKYGITKGYVLNSQKEVSKECDLIIFNKDTCPKFIFDKSEDKRFFPVDSIYSTIEIKSTLSKKELEDSLSKFKSVHELYNSLPESYFYSIEETMSNYYIGDKRGEDTIKEIYRYRPFPILFAYKMGKDLSFDKIIQEIKKLEYAPRIISVLDKGNLIIIDEQIYQRYKSIKSSKPIEDLNQTDVLDDLVELGYFDDRNRFYFLKEEDSKSYINLMTFYIFILENLNWVKLTPFNTLDLIAVWRRK